MLNISQSFFFDELRKMYSCSELVGWITDMLNVSKPTAYNYIHGKRSMNFDSMVLLMNSDFGQKGFNANEVIYNSQKGVLWNYHENGTGDSDSTQYLSKLNEKIKKVSVKDQSIAFATSELPIFYYMYFPALIGFKLFCWSKTVWSSDKADAPFVLSDIITSSNELFLKEIVDHYALLNTLEFWNVNMLDTTLKQIKYFRQMEWFQNIRDYNSLIGDIRNLVLLLQHILERGKKIDYSRNESSGESLVYENDIYFSSNVYMIRGGNREVLFTTLDNPNYMTTTNRNIVGRSNEWIDGMKKHSVSLTGNRGTFKKQFFDNLNNQIEYFDSF